MYLIKQRIRAHLFVNFALYKYLIIMIIIIVPILLLLIIFLSHLLSLMILSPPPWQLHIPGGRSVILMVVHIIIGEFVQLVMHVVITVIRKDVSGKFVVQTPMQAQQLLSMRILVQ